MFAQYKSPMGLSRAEKNRRKRDRKKRIKEEQRKFDEEKEDKDYTDNDDVEIEYVVEDVKPDLQLSTDERGDSQNSISEVLRRFHERSTTILISDDEGQKQDGNVDVSGNDDGDDDEDNEEVLSKKKQRKFNRPTVAELKNKVERADLVEAHDVTSADPEFLLFMKALPGTVPVPRHWGRKRKYLQGKVNLLYIFMFTNTSSYTYFSSSIILYYHNI